MTQAQHDNTDERDIRLHVIEELLRDASEYELDLVLRFIQGLLG